ncbi:hypothetical protein PMAYCL1PPCAC_14012, partial [Pristionchus mayeri]
HNLQRMTASVNVISEEEVLGALPARLAVHSIFVEDTGEIVYLSMEVSDDLNWPGNVLDEQRLTLQILPHFPHDEYHVIRVEGDPHSVDRIRVEDTSDDLLALLRLFGR